MGKNGCPLVLGSALGGPGKNFMPFLDLQRDGQIKSQRPQPCGQAMPSEPGSLGLVVGVSFTPLGLPALQLGLLVQ